VFAIVAMVASAVLVAPAAGTTDPAVECDHQYVKVHDNTVKVLPTGGDDTENLQCALDLATSMSWAKVKLIAGDYHTSFLEAEGFHGVFKGAGREKTTILTLPDGLDCVTRLDEAGDLFLLTFGGSDVVIKGLTIGVGGEAPCTEPRDGFIDDEEGYGYLDRSIGAIYATQKIGVSETCPTDTVDFRMRVYGVAVESVLPDFDAQVVEWDNFFTGVASGRLFAEFACVESWLRGDLIVRGSHFEGIRWGVIANSTHDSTVLFGGPKPWQGNTFSDVGVGAAVAATSDTQAFVKGNHMDNVHWWGVYLLGTDLNAGLTTSTVAKNHIVGIDTADGIGSLDFGPELGVGPLLQSTIAYNTIEVNSDFNGVYAIGTDGKIVGNRISGEMWSGIMLDGIFDEETFEVIYPTTGWYVARNNLKQVEPFGADIWLWNSTAQNTVICRCRHDTVMDLGVDNTIVHCDVLPPEEPVDTLQSIDRAMTRTLKALPYPQMRFGY